MVFIVIVLVLLVFTSVYILNAKGVSQVQDQNTVLYQEGIDYFLNSQEVSIFINSEKITFRGKEKVCELEIKQVKKSECGYYRDFKKVMKTKWGHKYLGEEYYYVYYLQVFYKDSKGNNKIASFHANYQLNNLSEKINEIIGYNPEHNAHVR